MLGKGEKNGANTGWLAGWSCSPCFQPCLERDIQENLGMRCHSAWSWTDGALRWYFGCASTRPYLIEREGVERERQIFVSSAYYPYTLFQGCLFITSKKSLQGRKEGMLGSFDWQCSKKFPSGRIQRVKEWKMCNWHWLNMPPVWQCGGISCNSLHAVWFFHFTLSVYFKIKQELKGSRCEKGGGIL